ncbi:MAG TPA: RHS repeat-associated core domain-containing protein [Solirubrobacterales bacterium]|nr:RHS repeat-associated core domain-containing protein [Solirubrobacterales bacterium]
MGKTANLSSGTQQVGVVQGEGTLRLSGGSLQLTTSPSEAVSSLSALKMTGGTLTGVGTLNITGGLTWTGASTMSGSGATVVKSGATAELSVFGELKLAERTLVNEGTATFANGAVAASQGAKIENFGTFIANSQWGTPEFRAGEGAAPKIVNAGTFEKTGGKEGSGKTTVGINFENKGLVESKSGTIAFSGGGSSNSAGEWKSTEGPKLAFTAGSYSMVEGSMSGSISVEGGNVSAEGVNGTAAKLAITAGSFSVATGSMTVATLNIPHGTLTGAGTLNISETLTWTGEKESTMSGAGKTVLKPGASAELSVWGLLNISERTFVNEGTVNFANGAISAGNGATIENLGTFKANSQWGAPEFRKASGAAPRIVNSGIFEKTGGKEGSGSTHVGISFENLGKVEAQSGNLSFSAGGSSSGSNEWIAAAGKKLAFTGGTFSLGAGTWSGTINFGGATATVQELHGAGNHVEVTAGSLSVGSGSLSVAELLISGGGTVNLSEPSVASTVATLKVPNGVLTGAGTLNISETLTWTGEKESTMSGTGKTVLKPGASAELSVWGYLNISERTFVNEGTVTFANGAINVSKGATLRNLGTFKANSQWGEPEFRLASKADSSPRFVNAGTFEKTAGTGKTVVEMNFENRAKINEQSGRLTIQHPVSEPASNEFGKHCKSGDPVDCATGNYSEDQTDFAIGGRGVGLDLTRTYSAQAAVAASSPGAFGYGWSASFSDHLRVEEGGAKVTLTKGDGSTIPFTRVAGTTYSGPAWSQESLSESPEAGYTFTAFDQTQYRFSGAGRLESIADRNGNETTLSYDEASRLKAVIDPTGRQLTFAYNTGGEVESVTDPMGHVVEYAYESGNLTSVTMPGEASPRWQFKYDASHRITQVTNGRGGKTTNEYDTSNRVISQTDPAGRTLTFKYEAFHTTITNKATGAVTDEWFTSDNEPYSITRGYGTASATTETFAYNEAGQIIGRTDGNGHTTTYGYDEAGNRTSEKDPLGHETKWTYNATHDLISTTLPGGETTTIGRDSHGNVESIARPAPGEATQTTSFVHDEQGQLTSVTDPLERTWTYGYNAYGDRTSEVDPLGETRTLAYDKDSRLVATVSPRGNLEGAEPAKYETTIARDAQGRPLKVTDPLGHTTEYTYDGNGNLASLTDAKGHTTKYTYNGDDEQTKVEKPNGATLETGYNGAGYVTGQTNSNGKTTTYVRNVLGQPVEVIDPLGRKTQETFDAAGNLVGLTDPAERKTTYSYDAADSLTGVGYSEEATPDASFGYDADGNLTSMTDGSGEASFAYDQLGRLTRSEDGHGDVVEYGYDLANQQTGVVYPNGKGVSRAYDGAGRLESITDWLGGTTTFGYDADSNLTGIAFPAESGNSDEYAYDPASRMSEAKFKKGSETLASLSYLRDPLGQVEKEARNGLPGPESVSYGYDKNNRLIEAGTASFEYDAADNLTKGIGSTNTYDAASQLETGTGVTYSYDKLGERVKASPSGGPATSYGYNQAGNLTSVSRPEEGEVAGIAESFAYDGTGLLVSKTSGLTTKHLAWDSSSELPLLLEDEDNSYIYGPNDLLIEQISSAEEPTYLHHDQLGSTRMLTDAGGETSATFSYAPYGGIEGRTGTATTRFGFADQYTDAETGLQYLRARFYDPQTGQFLSRDPIDALTGQPYSYGLDNPLTQSDPSGMFAIAGALGCLAGPEAAAVCAGIGTTAACAAISPCRNAAEEAANEVAHLFEGDESSDESSSQDAEPCKEIGDARQSLIKAEHEVLKLLSTIDGGPPSGPRGRALLAVILIVINAIRHSG